MKIYIDQSGRIEYTSHNTVVSYSNGSKKAVLLKTKDKRLLQIKFREAGKTRIFPYRVFALLIFFLLKDVKFSEVVIDIEYPGKGDLIKNYLLSDLRKVGINVNPDKISFGLIGKKSEAHWHGYYVFKKKRKPERVITLKEVLKHVF